MGLCLGSGSVVGTRGRAVEVEELLAVGSFIDFVSDFLRSIHLQYLERIEVEIK